MHGPHIHAVSSSPMPPCCLLLECHSENRSVFLRRYLKSDGFSRFTFNPFSIELCSEGNYDYCCIYAFSLEGFFG